MASKINVAALLFFLMLLFLLGEIGVAAVSTNRKLMVGVERESSATAATVAAANDVEINNHHAIPRESWDNGGQTGP